MLPARKCLVRHPYSSVPTHVNIDNVLWHWNTGVFGLAHLHGIRRFWNEEVEFLEKLFTVSEGVQESADLLAKWHEELAAEHEKSGESNDGEESAASKSKNDSVV
jgi:hypothetical protein